MKKKILVSIFFKKFIVAHYFVKEEKLESLRIIVECYYVLIEDKDKFYDWLLAENSDEMTILELVAQRPNKEIIKYLYDLINKTDESKLRINERRNNLFHLAAKRNECYPIVFFYTKLSKIFSQNIINLPNKYGITPLHYACYFGCNKVIDLLLDLGANINSQDNEGNTPLHYAINTGNLKTVKKLLVRGANKYIKRIDDKTPYETALDSNNLDAAKVLANKSWFRKYICIENELTPLKPTRNDLFLLLTLMIMLTIKLTYFFKIHDIFYDKKRQIPSLPVEEEKRNTKQINEFIHCLFGII